MTWEARFEDGGHFLRRPLHGSYDRIYLLAFFEGINELLGAEDVFRGEVHRLLELFTLGLVTTENLFLLHRELTLDKKPYPYWPFFASSIYSGKRALSKSKSISKSCPTVFFS